MAAPKAIDDCPLTTQDYTAIQRALERLNTHRIKCEKAKLAGYDVDGEITVNEYYRQQFENNKKVYFPGKP